MTPHMDEVILASQSQIRADLLRNAGVQIEAVPARIDEDAIKTAMQSEDAPPNDVAATLADLKAQKIATRNPGRLVIGADQVLAFDGQIFDKPKDLDAARLQLQALRGKQHQLLSAVVIYKDSDCLLRELDQVTLTMRRFDDLYRELPRKGWLHGFNVRGRLPTRGPRRTTLRKG